MHISRFIIDEDKAAVSASSDQPDLFTDYEALARLEAAETAEMEKERRLQLAVLDIKKTWQKRPLERNESAGRGNGKIAKRADRRTSEMKKPYDDILYLPHHVSKNHPQMSMGDRAAQFSPFAALTGYDEAIGETGRLTEQRRELSEPEQAEINSCLISIASKLNQRTMVRVEYFVLDAVKAGGAYVAVTGGASKNFLWLSGQSS